MALLIDDILKLSRITRSEMTFRPVNLSALAVSVAEELRGQEPERKVEFVIREGIETRGDAQLLRVALQNLFGEAFEGLRQTVGATKVTAVGTESRTVSICRLKGSMSLVTIGNAVW